MFDKSEKKEKYLLVTKYKFNKTLRWEDRQ